MMRTLIILLSVNICLVACTNQANSTTNTATPEKTQPAPTQNQIKSAGIWIDVRSADEYRMGHLSGSVNIPVDKIADKITDVQPNKDAPIHLYCRSGRRAEMARQTLINMGYTHVINHGGYDELIKQGYQ